MKHLFYSLLILTVGCQSKSDKGNAQKEKASEKSTVNNTVDKDMSTSFSYPFSEKPQVFRLKKNKPTEIKTKKGVKIRIEASSLVHADGSPVTGEVELRVSEVFSKKDFVLQNCQTVSDGRLLVSGGSVNVQAYEGGKELQLKKGSTYGIEVPVQSDRPMELFEGTRDELGNMNWKPLGKKLEVAKQTPEPGKQEPKEISKSGEVVDSSSPRDRKYFLSSNNFWEMTDDEFKSYTHLSPDDASEDDFNTVTRQEGRREMRKQKRQARKNRQKETLYYRPVEVGYLGWLNVDAFTSASSIADGYSIQFPEGAPGTFGTYLIFKDVNSTISALTKTNPGQSVVKLNNQLPVGERVRAIVYIRKNEQIWHYKVDTVITKDLVLKPTFIKAPMSDFERAVTP